MKVVFDENKILEKLHPYVKTGFYKHLRDIKEGSYVNLYDFNCVYSYLNSKEKYEISCLLEKNGIELATSIVPEKSPNRSIQNKDINMGFRIERENSTPRDNWETKRIASFSYIKLCRQIQDGNILAEEILVDRNKGMLKREALRFCKIFNL